MKEQDRVEVKIKGPKLDALEGWEGCGFGIIAIPSLLYGLFKEFVLNRGKKPTWHVQVLRRKTLGKELVLEETYDSYEQAWQRHEELIKRISEGQMSLNERNINKE